MGAKSKLLMKEKKVKSDMKTERIESKLNGIDAEIDELKSKEVDIKNKSDVLIREREKLEKQKVKIEEKKKELLKKKYEQFPLFEISMPAAMWKRLLKSLNVYTNDAVFKISESGIRICLVDPAHVAVMDLMFSPGYFTVFGLNENVNVGIDFELFIDALVGIPNNDMVSYSVFKNIDGVLTNRISSIGKYATIIRNFKCVDTASLPDPKVPNLNLRYFNINIPIKKLYDAFKSFQISDHSAWTVDRKNLYISTDGDESDGKIVIPVKHKKPKSFSGMYCSLFSDDYMENALSIINSFKGEQLIIGLSNDNPIELRFVNRDSKDDRKKVLEGMILLAPRIESE